jgi:hypothetical protein
MNEGISSGDARSYFPQYRIQQQQQQQTNAEYLKILPARDAANPGNNALEIARLYPISIPRSELHKNQNYQEGIYMLRPERYMTPTGRFYLLGDPNRVCLPPGVGISRNHSYGRCRTCFKLLVDHVPALEKPTRMRFNCPDPCAFDRFDGLR